MRKLLLSLSLFMAACSHPADSSRSSTEAISRQYDIPAGMSVVEYSPDGYFIRLSSARRATTAMIRTLYMTLSDRFDRIDLCVDSAHERGDEYLSIIGNTVFDYENDNIYPL